MESAPHPVVLERYFFTRSIVVTVASHKPGEGVLPVKPENAISLTAIADDPGHYQVVMQSIFNSTGDVTAPYIIDMECVGLFVVDKRLVADDAAREVMIIAHNLLYGAIREAVAWITGRQPFGQLVFGLSVLQSPVVLPSPKPDS